jgi:hypothetical protein
VGTHERENRQGEGGIWLMYFIYLYENRTVKPVAVAVIGNGMRENDGG